MGSYVFQTSGRLSHGEQWDLLRNNLFFATLLRPMVGSDKRHCRGIEKRSKKKTLTVERFRCETGGSRPCFPTQSMCLYVALFIFSSHKDVPSFVGWYSSVWNAQLPILSRCKVANWNKPRTPMVFESMSICGVFPSPIWPWSTIW